MSTALSKVLYFISHVLRDTLASTSAEPTRVGINVPYVPQRKKKQDSINSDLSPNPPVFISVIHAHVGEV